MSVAVIIGAAGEMGTAIAADLVERYDTIVLVGRRREPLAELCSALERISGRIALPLQADVRDTAKIVTALKEHRLWEDIDLVVNAAGITHYGTHEISEADLREMIDINLVAPISLHNAILPLFISRNRGTSIHVLSNAAGST